MLKLKMLEIELKFILFYNTKVKPNIRKIKIGILISIAAFLCIIALVIWHNSKSKYFYIDYEGNTGVADWCGATEAGLICKTSNGRVMVNQYWRGK